jgi:hypothetical protein
MGFIIMLPQPGRALARLLLKKGIGSRAILAERDRNPHHQTRGERS